MTVVILRDTFVTCFVTNVSCPLSLSVTACMVQHCQNFLPYKALLRFTLYSTNYQLRPLLTLDRKLILIYFCIALVECLTKYMYTYASPYAPGRYTVDDATPTQCCDWVGNLKDRCHLPTQSKLIGQTELAKRLGRHTTYTNTDIDGLAIVVEYK